MTNFNTNPLERSEWSIGRGSNFMYFDFDFAEGKAMLHCAYDFNGKPLGNVTADFERQVVEEDEAAQWASEMVNRAFQWFRETTGREARPLKSARAFIRAVQSYGDNMDAVDESDYIDEL